MEIDGSQVTFGNPHQAIAGGVAFVPADRKLQGLVHGMSVRENLVMASTSRLRGSGGRRSGGASRGARGLRGDAHPRELVPRPGRQLRGGNQQKVVLGKWLATSPRVFMLDEPTRGVDVGAKGEIYRSSSTRQRGRRMLIWSSENPELLMLCDRMLVMFRGRVAAELHAGDATEARIAHFAGATVTVERRCATPSARRGRRAAGIDGRGRFAVVLVLLVGIFVFFSLTQPDFFSQANIENLLTAARSCSWSRSG